GGELGHGGNLQEEPDEEDVTLAKGDAPVKFVPGSAVRAEPDRLLEGRAVRPAHGVRDQAGNELDALPRGVRTPLGRIRPLRRCEAVRSRLQRSPERVAARIAIAV